MLLALKLKLTAAAIALAVPALITATDTSGVVEAGLASLPPGTLRYRTSGEFTRDGRAANAPIETVKVDGFAIMVRQVTVDEYGRCVDDRGCAALSPAGNTDGARPVVQVSWRDAQAYAAWLSRTTGESYRLPTGREWAYAAGDRFHDEALPENDDDPSKRWIARYERETEGRDATDDTPQPVGRFGINDRGLMDIGGNVWEWTSDCFRRVTLDRDDNRLRGDTLTCGVRVAEGRHRAYISDFIRDARGGGCAAGKPPSNLGFRLVRDDGFWQRLRPKTWLGA